MPKKNRKQTGTPAEPMAAIGTMTGNAADAEPAATVVMEDPNPLPPIGRPAWIDGPPVTETGRSPLMDGDHRRDEPTPARNWGDPYKSIFNCPEQGFELGEHRQFKQRQFRFRERPADDVLATLKEQGFTYRDNEKAWTIPANPDTRRMTDELARSWAGPNYIRSVER
jgi:hypothetical protein